MKITFLKTTVLIFIGTALSAQVGVNTTDPKTTMDVNAKRDSGGNITDNTQIVGLQAPRLTRAELTVNTATYGADQRAALIYITDISGGTATGQRININAVGYYSFDGSLWQKISANDINIYKDNGTLTNNRTLTHDDKTLTFANGSGQSTVFTNSSGIGFTQRAGATGRASIGLYDNSNSAGLWLYADNNGASQVLASTNATSLNIGTNSTVNPTPITFATSTGGGNTGVRRMIVTGNGNVGINTSLPTEKFDVNGITRLRSLPLNGATNAIFTTPTGTESATQNQTFTANRTVVADSNGVLGYVNALPSDAGTSRALLITNAPGTQNVSGQFTPNAAIGQFTNESLDVYNAWNNNVFTVPANMAGVYIIVMQNSNSHVSTGTATPTWHTAAYYERSTDGGTSWNTMIKHTYADLAGTIVDNGNTLYWTGFLNVGDQIRVRLSCNATTNNIVNYGGLSITKLAQ